MSKFVKLLAGVLLTGCAAFAQDSTATPPAAASPKHHQMRGDAAEQRLKRLNKKLSLTDDQKEKVRPILQDEQKQMAALDDDTTLTPQQKHKKIREIRMSSRTQLDTILTPEQKAKLPAVRTGGHGRRHQQPTPGSTPRTDTTTPQ